MAAKIKFGMMMTDARGKLGGQVFSRNRAGAYVRTKVTPVNPRTTFQQSVRSVFGSISSAWSALTAVQRASWNEAVTNWQRTNIFGDLTTPTGKSLFQRLNNGLIQNVAGSSPLLFAPSPVEVPIVDEVSADWTRNETTNSFVLQWSHQTVNPVNPSDYLVQIRATAPMNPGRYYHQNLLRVIAIGDLDDDTYDLMDAYIDRFGVPVTGRNIFVEVRVVSKLTGQLGVPFSTQVVWVTAP